MAVEEGEDDRLLGGVVPKEPVHGGEGLGADEAVYLRRDPASGACGIVDVLETAGWQRVLINERAGMVHRDIGPGDDVIRNPATVEGSASTGKCVYSICGSDDDPANTGTETWSTVNKGYYSEDGSGAVYDAWVNRSMHPEPPGPNGAMAFAMLTTPATLHFAASSKYQTAAY